MDWRGRLLGPEVLQEAAADWIRKMKEGTPAEVGVVLLVGNCKTGENVLGASSNLSKEDVKAIIANLKTSRLVREN